MTIERMIQDGLEVAQFLTRTLRKPKVCLLGHSWGSALGVLMLKRRPDLFSAFVGTGQQVNMQKNEEHNYQWTLNQAERLGDREALEALQMLGSPPYTDFNSLLTLLHWTDRLTDGDGDPLRPCPSPIAPDFTAEDRSSMQQGAEFSRQQLLADLNGIDLLSFGTEFDVPMFFFEGTHDHHTPIDLAEEYFSVISAPHKEFVRFEGCHHFVVMNKPGDLSSGITRTSSPVAVNQDRRIAEQGIDPASYPHTSGVYNLMMSGGEYGSQKGRGTEPSVYE